VEKRGRHNDSEPRPAQNGHGDGRRKNHDAINQDHRQAEAITGPPAKAKPAIDSSNSIITVRSPTASKIWMKTPCIS
jgi:hypothetical protein